MLKTGKCRTQISDESGITLLELIIALAVILIVSVGLTAPMSRSDRRTLNQASLQMQADIRLAQQMAIIEGQRYYIVLNPQRGSYSIGTSRIRANETIFLENGVSFDQSRGIGGNNFTDSWFGFTPQGTLTNMAGRIFLRAGNYRQELTVLVGTGRTAVFTIR
jgi:type II secretory pathway pseudopilin PulG